MICFVGTAGAADVSFSLQRVNQDDLFPSKLIDF